MDKIDIHRTNNDEAVSMLANKLNELVEGYNKIMIKLVKIKGRIDNIMVKL